MQTFEEYLKQKHMEKYPMILDDELSDHFDIWVGDLEAYDFIEYADEFKHLAEQSLVQRVREDIEKSRPTISVKEYGEEGYSDSASSAYDDILNLPSLSTPKPKGDK